MMNFKEYLRCVPISIYKCFDYTVQRLHSIAADKATAAQNTQNPNSFTYPYYGSMIYWVTRGYVVLDDVEQHRRVYYHLLLNQQIVDLPLVVRLVFVV